MSLQIVPMQLDQAAALAGFFSEQPPNYLKHFHPFSFDKESLEKMLETVTRDRYFALSWEGEIAGLAMLRGLDAGYAAPSFGVVIGFKFRQRGLARLALRFCESVCRLDQISEIFLKVYPDNPAAESIYHSEGFTQTGICAQTCQIEMRKIISHK